MLHPKNLLYCLNILNDDTSLKSMLASAIILVLLLVCLLACFPSDKSLFFASLASSSMLTNYSHLLTVRQNKHFPTRGLVLLSFFLSFYFCLFCFYFFSVLQCSNQSIEMYMQILLMNGMCTLNCVCFYICELCLTIDRIPK